jgi:hypothetical protein
VCVVGRELIDQKGRIVQGPERTLESLLTAHRPLGTPSLAPERCGITAPKAPSRVYPGEDTLSHGHAPATDTAAVSYDGNTLYARAAV